MMAITPKNWSEFQHYKDRSPAWIKLHRGLLDDFEFNRLPLASRALAPLLWLLASEYEGGRITASLEAIAFRIRADVVDLVDALKPLIESGFFIDDSGTLASCKHNAIPEERRGELETQEREETETRSVAKATRPDVSKDFDEFWKAYPKREGPNSRKSALQRYESARKRGVEHATVMAGLKRYVATLTTAGQIGTRYVQQAETWLSKESWSDHADVEGAPEVIEVHAIKLGTPEWRAWFDFSEANGPKFVHSQMVQVENIGMGQMAFRSRWPPGYENQITAPTEIMTPISEHAA